MLDGLTFNVATGEERSLAVTFRNQVYEDEFGDAASDELEANAFYLVARTAIGQIAATFRFVEERPFEIERYVEIRSLLAVNRLPAELGRLCVRPEWRRVRQQAFLHLGLLKLAIEFAKLRGITDFLIGALGNLQTFYAKAFFKPLGLSYRHPVGGTLHVMHLDLVALRAQHSHSSEPFLRMLLGDAPPNIIL